jgi:hypothetical protein
MAETLVVNSSVAEISKEVIASLMASGLVEPKRKGKVQRTNWERLLAYEYIGKFYANMPHWFRVEVGPTPNGSNDRLYAKTRRWADCVVRMPDHLLIIEFKMKVEPAVVSQLEHYSQLLPETPQFEKYRNEPVRIKIVGALIDDKVHAYIESRGIDVEMYQPSNYEAWYKQVILKEKVP